MNPTSAVILIKGICMRQFKNLIGKKFGKLTVVERTDDYISPKGERKVRWVCVCDCGNIATVTSKHLLSGNTKSCGCLSKKISSEKMLKDMTGKRIGHLTVIKRVEDYIALNGHHKTQWLCQCDCGNTIVMRGSSLRRRGTHSCGCLTSKSESIICDYCLNNNIIFEIHKKFENLVGVKNGKLSYDFYLPQYNLLIECQGEQHYRPIEYFGGEKQFVIQREHDKRKRNYVENNNYELLEIPYWEYDNVENILNEKLEEVRQNGR